MHSSRCNAVEDAESTRFASIQKSIDTSVVTWWPHYAKGISVSANQHTEGVEYVRVVFSESSKTNTVFMLTNPLHAGQRQPHVAPLVMNQH